MIERFLRIQGLPPGNGYSHAVVGSGRLVAISGQLPLDEGGHLVSDTDVLAQSRQVFRNLAVALRAAGARPVDVLRLGFYLTDLADLPAVRTARDEFLADVPDAPASSLVQVAGLVVPGARLEVDALALTG